MKLLKLITVAVFFSLILFTVSCEKNENNDLELKNAIEKTETIVLNKNGKEKEIRLDYHEKYGVIKAHEFPMNPKGVQREPTLEDFLEKADFKKEEIKDYKIQKESFSGIGLSEHRMEDGNVIRVPHRYEKESAYRLNAKLNNGKTAYVIIIIRCSNGMTIIIILR